MSATVTVNFMTVVHKSSNGVVFTFPDVCKTPAAPSPVPIPYPNIAMSSTASDTASTVKADGQPIMVKTSKFSTSSGDDAGTLLGVISNKVKGSANPMMYSMDVKAEGKNVFRLLDLMLNNGGSKPTNTPPGPNLQPPAVVLGTSLDPDKYKIVEVKWDKTKCKCGDRVGIETETENFADGMIVPHTIRRGKKRIIDNTRGSVSGDKVDIQWLSRNGPWSKKTTKLSVTATGNGGPKKSSNELEVEVPAEKEETVSVANNTARAVVRVRTRAGGRRRYRYTNTGTLYGNPYGYDISIKKGVFQIHCKVELQPQAGVKSRKLRRWKKKWRKEIEAIWDRKWKEHRTNCKRGDRCNCPGGCCLFPIRVKCSFVDSGGHVQVKLHAGKASHPDRWWNAANWYEQLSGQEGNGAVVHAHEFGHNIGLWDEYAGGSTIARYYDVQGSIMERGTNVMAQHWSQHPSPDKSIHKWFLDAVDEKYKLLKI